MCTWARMRTRACTRAYTSACARVRARVHGASSHRSAQCLRRYALIDAKRRREFLDWALGPQLSIVTSRVAGLTQGLRDEMGAQADVLRQEAGVAATKLRHEAALERTAVREALATKTEVTQLEGLTAAVHEAREQIGGLHEALAHQADAQRALGEQGEAVRARARAHADVHRAPRPHAHARLCSRVTVHTALRAPLSSRVHAARLLTRARARALHARRCASKCTSSCSASRTTLRSGRARRSGRPRCGRGRRRRPSAR